MHPPASKSPSPILYLCEGSCTVLSAKGLVKSRVAPIPARDTICHMARIVALVNQKGGVGKTTTAINLGAYLAEAGYRVLLVDVDPQGNASSGLSVRPSDVPRGTYELMIGTATLEQATVQTAHHNLHLVPATQALAGANIELVSAEHREYRLSKALEAARLNYEVILLDAPPSLGLVTINALVAADEVLIPVQSEYYALEGLSQLLSTIELVRTNLKPHLALLGAVITLHDKRTKLAADVVREIRKFFPGRVFQTEIPRNVRLSEAPSYGKSILSYEPWSKGARAYRALTQEVIAAWNSVPTPPASTVTPAVASQNTLS
jgi:chromosome partitioning protein